MTEKRPKNYWTDAKARDYILDRVEKGLSLSCSVITKEEGGLVIRAYREYGTWSNFLKEVGVERNKERYQDYSKVLQDLEELVKTKKVKTNTDVLKEKEDLYPVIRKYGGWNKVVADLKEQRGFCIDGYHLQVRKEEVYRTISNRYERGESIKHVDLDKEGVVAYSELKKLGGLTKIKEELGITKKQNKQVRDKLLGEIVKRYNEGKSMLYVDACEDDRNFVARVQRTFGGWRAAQVEAGILDNK